MTTRHRKPNLRRVAMTSARIWFTILGVSALGLGLGVAGEPATQRAEPAASENRAQPADARFADKGHVIRPRAGIERSDDRPSLGKPAVDRPDEPGARLHKLPSPPRRPGTKPAGIAQPPGAAGASPLASGLTGVPGSVNPALSAAHLEVPHRPLVPPATLKPATKMPLPVTPTPGHGPVVIGGPTFAPAKHTAMLNGGGMKHKP